MPEYYSGKDNSYGLSGKINITRNPHSREALLRKKKWEKKHGRPYPTEQEQHQNLLDKFGERVAKSEQKETNALVEQDYQVEQNYQVQEKQFVKQKETNDFVEHAPQVEQKQSKEQTPKPELESRNKELELEEIIPPLITQGEKVYKQKDYQNAYDIFSQVVAHQPDNSYALFHLSSSANQTRRYIIAVETAQKLIDSNQYTAQAYYFQAQSLEKMGRLSEAASAYQKAGAEIAEANKAFMRLEQDRLFSGFSNKPAKSSDIDKSSKQDKTKTTKVTSFSHSSRTRNTRALSHSQPTHSTAQKAEPLDVGNLTQVEKLLEAVNRGARQLPEEVAEEIKALFSPATLAMMMGVFAVYMAASLTGFSQGLTIGMGIAGVVFFGLDAVAILGDLAGFASAVNANTEKDLDKAGKHLASLVAMVGVDTIMTLLSGKVAQKIGQGVDNLRQVDEVHAHSEGAGNLDDASRINASRINAERTTPSNESLSSAEVDSSSVARFSQLDDAARNSLNHSLSGLADVQKSQYLDAIATNPVLGQKLLEFKNFGSPQRLSNVLDAIDSVDDVERLKRVFDEDNLGSLSSDMSRRYEELLEEVAETGQAPPPPQHLQDLVENQTFGDRLEVLEQASQTKRTLENQLTPEVYDNYKLGGRNIAFGSTELNLPNGQQINEEVISISGKKFPQQINGRSSEHQIDNRRIVPPPNKGDDRLPVTERTRGGHQDSERKMAYYILEQIEARTGINVDPSNLPEGESYSGFSGKIAIHSEMTPCTSCAKILTKQLDRLFGKGNIKVEVKYGVIYRQDISDTIR